MAGQSRPRQWYSSAPPFPQRAAPSPTARSNSRQIQTLGEAEPAKLQIGLVKLQEWIKHKGLKVVVLFEGQDAAGKGGVIQRITESLYPRHCRVAALGTPTQVEKTQRYFQRHVTHLPAAGQMVRFDRSRYNRAGIERVKGFCPEEAIANSCAAVRRLSACSCAPQLS